jgi:hypothetical protein
LSLQALKYADKQEAAKDKQETAEAAKSEAAKSETAKSMAPKSETAKTEAADGADAVVVSPRHSSAGMVSGLMCWYCLMNSTVGGMQRCASLKDSAWRCIGTFIHAAVCACIQPIPLPTPLHMSGTCICASANSESTL